MRTSNTHWRKVDYRKQSLIKVIEGLQVTINELSEVVELGGWYDGSWFQEESEPIYGLGLIALQHYINGSIKDRFEIVKGKEHYYKTDSILIGFQRTGIELIVSLANFSKHKEEGSPHKHTRECLEHFGLNCTEGADLNDSPIFSGIEILSSTWNLLEIADSVMTWRESLWIDEFLQIRSLDHPDLTQ